ncbi:MAG TPA: hypothetical protein VD861_08180 [Pyrinomonadaceae bacterium]|nr:hypothetical protein [Pyrinomonadaceae bacterium]
MITPSERAASRQAFASRALSLAAAAALIGPLLYVMVTLLHPPGHPGNAHAVVFREYAVSQTWVAIHLAQLAALVAGLVGLAGVALSMLRLQERGRLLALVAVCLAAAGIPTAIVLQAVDGIALKRAVDAWVAEGGAVESPGFAAARAIRWVEEGLNAGFGLTLGSAVTLIGAAMARGALYPRPLGWVGAAIGVGVLVGAVVVAGTGFSPAAQTWVLARNPALWLWTAAAGALMWRRLRPLDGASSA